MSMDDNTDTVLQPLPENMCLLFPEYGFGDLSWEQDRDLVTARVLAEGTWDDMMWLRKTAGDDALREWMVKRRGAGIDRRRLRFWELILDIPRRKVNAWLRDPARQVWDSRIHP